MLLDHRERIDGADVQWNPINEDLGEIGAMNYAIYKTVNGSQELIEWGTVRPRADGLQGNRLHHTLV